MSDNITYKEGIPGYLPLGVDGMDGNSGYSVHFSTLSLENEDDSSVIKYCIKNGKPLSNNQYILDSSVNKEDYNNEDVVIDDFGNFASISSVSEGEYILYGKIIRSYDDESQREAVEYDSSFIDASLTYYLNNINTTYQNGYNAYDFAVPSGSDGVYCPLYRYSPNTDITSGAINIRPTLSSRNFIDVQIPKCHFVKFVMTFSTGLVYEQTFDRVPTNDSRYYAMIDVRYYYGYGRGIADLADPNLAGPYDASYGGAPDASFWGEFTPSAYSSEGSSEALNQAATINYDTFESSGKHSIVDAYMEFHHKDGNLYRVKINIVPNNEQ